MDESVFLKIPLFQNIPKSDLIKIVDELPVETYYPGAYLFRDGDPGENLYVVIDGALEIVLAADSPDEMLLKTCGPGEYVGEMGLILGAGALEGGGVDELSGRTGDALEAGGVPEGGTVAAHAASAGVGVVSLGGTHALLGGG